MLEYFINVRNKDVAHRQKFVVVGTILSFLLILGIWIPFRIMQFRLATNANKETVAENKTETASPSPLVAGDATTKNLPFLSGAKTSPEALVFPSATPELIPTASPDLGTDTPLINEPSSEPASATPSTTDFPTL